jgi:hypothetical protein
MDKLTKVVTDIDWEQDRQWTYNVTLSHVCESLLPWESNKFVLFTGLCVLACG